MLLYFKKFNKKKLFINTNNFFQPTFECYIANSKSEIKAAQRLRYKVFFAERENKIIRLNSFKRETDDYDKYADHIIVTYKKTKFSKTKVIGTYRLLRQSIALKNKGFYSSNEYDLSNLLKSNKYNNLLELSRSCINKKFRKKNVLQLMWKKIHEYVVENKVDALFGTASFLETNIKVIEPELKFLNENFAMPDEIKVKALDEYKVNLSNNIPILSKMDIAKKLPTLIKAYLRLNAYIGDGAVLDNHFKTTDVFIFLPFSKIKETYLKKFSN